MFKRGNSALKISNQELDFYEGKLVKGSTAIKRQDTQSIILILILRGEANLRWI